jgi:hypothetical protein
VIPDRSTLRESARYWTSRLLPGADLPTATFSTQRFQRHWHEGYVIQVIQRGAQSYQYRGATRIAASGSIAAINPGEVHTGERATPHGWTYRAFYPTVRSPTADATRLMLPPRIDPSTDGILSRDGCKPDPFL